MLKRGSKPAVTSRESIVEVWWIRIVITVVTAAGGVLFSAVWLTDGIHIIITLYGMVTVSLVAIELLRRNGTVNSSGIGFTRSTASIAAMAGVLAIGMLVFIISAALLLGGTLSVTAPQMKYLEISLLVLSSAGEEILFRGTIFQALMERFGQVTAIIITSVLFGLAHSMNPEISFLAIVNVMLAGVVLGAMVARTQSLWSAISFHAVWNSIVYFFIGSVSGQKFQPVISTLELSAIPDEILWLVSGPFGVEQGLLTTILLLGAIPVIYRYMKPDFEIIAARAEMKPAVH